MLGVFSHLCLVFGHAGHRDQGSPGLLQDPWCLGLGRLADRRLQLVHLGQFGDEPGLELCAELDQQPLDGTAEFIARLGQDVERGRLDRRPPERPRSCPGFARPSASMRWRGSGLFARRRRRLPAGRRSLPGFRPRRGFWPGRRRGGEIRTRRWFSPFAATCSSRRVSSSTQQAQRLFLGARRRRSGRPLRGTCRLGQRGQRAAGGGLQVGEQGVSRQGGGRGAKLSHAVARSPPGRLSALPCRLEHALGVGDHGLLVTDELPPGRAGGWRYVPVACVAPWRSATSPARGALP